MDSEARYLRFNARGGDRLMGHPYHRARLDIPKSWYKNFLIFVRRRHVRDSIVEWLGL